MGKSIHTEEIVGTLIKKQPHIDKSLFRWMNESFWKLINHQYLLRRVKRYQIFQAARLSTRERRKMPLGPLSGASLCGINLWSYIGGKSTRSAESPAGDIKTRNPLDRDV